MAWPVFRVKKQVLPSASAGFLLGLLLNPEDGGNVFLCSTEQSITTQKATLFFTFTAMRPSNPVKGGKVSTERLTAQVR
jgi:hypothetical protein